MKTLKGHVICYDAECPMCNLYTKAFTETGMLERNGRLPYQQLPEAIIQQIDRQRAADEIVLVNPVTGSVSYGISSLFKVIGHNFPVFRPLFSFPPFAWLMKHFYAFISYNRRMIVPADMARDAFTVQPSFRAGYRIAYLLITLLLTGWILGRYSPLMAGIIPSGSWYREWLVCGGQIIFQALVVSALAPRRCLDYLGNMMTISFAGALLLLPLVLISRFVTLPAEFYAAGFLAVASLMLMEHIRRSRLLQLGWTLTFSWILYRLLVLFFIF